MPLLTLGDIRFEIGGAEYQALERRTAFAWAAQDRIGRPADLQFMGRGEDTITLTGTLLPQFRGTLQSIEDLRTAGDEGRPRILTSGTGRVLGKWVITDVTHTEDALFEDGAALKLTFTVALRYYGGTGT